MSSSLECEFLHHETGWYYLLQDWDCPVQCWDWREHATAYGPFQTRTEAEEHLHATQPNPGGASYPTRLTEQHLKAIQFGESPK